MIHLLRNGSFSRTSGRSWIRSLPIHALAITLGLPCSSVNAQEPTLDGTWAVGSGNACATFPYRLETDAASWRFTDRNGATNVEQIVQRSNGVYITETVSSPNERVGTRWQYRFEGPSRAEVRNLSTNKGFVLVRCQAAATELSTQVRGANAFPEGSAHVSLETEAPVTDCDILASFAYDEQRKAPGVSYAALNAPQAVAQCTAAAAAYPDSGRIQFQLGRALEKANRVTDAIRAYTRAAKLKHGGGFNNLGELYRDGKGFPQDMNRARIQFEEGAVLGYAEAEFNLANMILSQDGSSADVERARSLLFAALKSGYIDAQRALQSLPPPQTNLAAPALPGPGQQAAQQQASDDTAAGQQAPRGTEAKRIAAIKESWSVIDPNVRLCVDRKLQGVGQNVEILIYNFVPASDNQVQGLLANCNVISSQRLVRKAPCNVDGMPTVCNDEFVFKNFPATPLTGDQLVTAFVAGRIDELGTVPVEDPQAKLRRLEKVEQKRRQAIVEQLQAKLAVLAVPENTFSFKNASALQKTIASGASNPKTGIEDLQRWSSEVDRLVDANKNEEIRLATLQADMMAHGEIAVSGAGTGPDPKAARINAYYDVFLVQLRSMLGVQADASIGDQFRKSADTDIEKFRAVYFTSDTADNCTKGKPPIHCDIKGIFKANALKADVQKIVQASIGSGGRGYRFILRYPQSDDATTTFLIAQISAAFINSGYQIITKSAEDEAEAKGAFDFYLNVLEINQDSALDASANFITYNLKARIKLINRDNDPTKQHDLANVPVVSTKRVPRDLHTPVAARAKELLQIQGNELAHTILQEVDSRMLALQDQPPPSLAPTSAVASTAAEQYSVHIAGLSQRDRERIRAVRDLIGKTLKLSTPTRIDPDATDDQAVQIIFQPVGEFDPEDLVDALYSAFKDQPNFKIKFDGKKAFIGSM